MANFRWHRYYQYRTKAGAERAYSKLKRKYGKAKVTRQKPTKVYPRGSYIVYWYGRATTL